MSNTRYHSSYIVDVTVTEKCIKLVDSSRQAYYMPTEDKALIAKYDTWFDTVFSKGLPQYLLVFKCHEITKDNEVYVIVDDLLHYEV